MSFKDSGESMDEKVNEGVAIGGPRLVLEVLDEETLVVIVAT